MKPLSSQSIVSWMASIGSRYKEQRRHEKELRVVTDLIVDVADPTIKQVGRYQKDLREAVTAAIGYCADLVDDIPGPVRLSRNRYYADPLIKAVFASGDQMMELLKSAVEDKSSQDWKHKGEGVALLTMARTERTIFGYEKHNDMLLGDVAKRTVNFIDHRIVALSPILSATKKKLQDRALEVLATVAMERITTIRGNIAELRERKVQLQSIHRILTGRNRTMGLFAHPSYETGQKINKVKQQLVEVEAELEAERGRLATPADSLTLLEEIMASPDESLIMDRKSLRVDWMNVLLDGKNSAEGNDISLAEFSVGKELQRWAVMVTFQFEDVSSS